MKYYGVGVNIGRIPSPDKDGEYLTTAVFTLLFAWHDDPSEEIVVPSGIFNINSPPEKLDRNFSVKIKRPGDYLHWRWFPHCVISPQMKALIEPLVGDHAEFKEVTILDTDDVMYGIVFRKFIPVDRSQSQFEVRRYIGRSDKDWEVTRGLRRHVRKIKTMMSAAFKREDLEGVHLALMDDYRSDLIVSETMRQKMESLGKLQLRFYDIRIVEADGSVTGPPVKYPERPLGATNLK